MSAAAAPAAATAAPAPASDVKSGETVVEKGCEPYVLADNPPVTALDVREAFSKLEAKEKLYAHHMCRASWLGSEIVYVQTSPESLPIFRLLQTVFRTATSLAAYMTGYLAADDKHTVQEWMWFTQWCAAFYTNSGNYLSFGDTKIVPRLNAERFAACIRACLHPKALAARKSPLSSAEQKSVEARIEVTLKQWLEALYSLKSNDRSLSFPESGVSTYYSPNITKDDIEKVQKVMNTANISAYNTRLFKDANGRYELKLASATAGAERVVEGVRVTTGDHSEQLTKVVASLKLAKQYVANEHQSKMLDAYIASFDGGDIEQHKLSQRHWIKDVGPAVETNIGFIESYRDPFGSRGEFEGMVAVVNKETSRKFGVLVDGAPALLTKLPWGKAFEKDEFKRPDFTSLEVIAFAGSGIPAGINIPNYDDIRQNEGFKNVSLGNVLSAKPPNRPITFLSADDQKLFKELKGHAFEVQVGCHELLGHGSGKLFMADKDGKLNFDVKTVVNPLTKAAITSWYKAGETYDSVFGYFASSMEECRAELVGLLLSTDREVLKVFGFNDAKEQDQITYVNWLNMVRAGLLGLEFYTPEKKKWGQAHMQARYGILTTLLAAGGGLVTITETKDANGVADLLVSLDRSKIMSVGVPAVNKFLTQIQVVKASADLKAGTELYHAATDVSDKMLPLRATVVARKQARPMMVQAHTYISPTDSHEVLLQEFEPTPEGVIQSMLAHFD